MGTINPSKVTLLLWTSSVKPPMAGRGGLAAQTTQTTGMMPKVICGQTASPIPLHTLHGMARTLHTAMTKF